MSNATAVVVAALLYNVLSLAATRSELGLTRDQLNATERQLDLTERGQVADRYTKAIDQLGSVGPGKPDVRLGAIFALLRIARDSAPDCSTVIEVLGSFVREHSREPTTQASSSEPGRPGQVAPRLDIQAALTALGQLGPSQGGEPTNLNSAYIPGANLAGARLRHALLARSNLGSARLTGADLRDTDLTEADLTGADLTGADLRGADLREATVSTKQINKAITDTATQR